MNKMTIGFSRPKKWKLFSWLIRKVEGTEYSHVFVTWHCTNIDRRKVFEAVGSGIRILSNVNFKDNAKVIELYDFYVTDEQLFKIEQQAHDMTGRPYGFKAVLGLLVMRVKNAWYRFIGSDTRAKNEYKDGEYSQVCVEAAGLVLSQIDGVKRIDFEDSGLLEINELAQVGEKAPQERVDRINRKKKR